MTSNGSSSGGHEALSTPLPLLQSSVKAYVPPSMTDGGSGGDEPGRPLLCIHTRPSYMKRISEVLLRLDTPPQMLQLEFQLVEVAEDDLTQLRHRINHPVLNRIAGESAMQDDVFSRRAYSPMDIRAANTSGKCNVLQPQMQVQSRL
ncbi:Type II secretion system (T2SS)-related protein GspDN2 [Andalucia godoyi]|uniref:Type II secretion system (T2SS)-related protein GspDN2 n=1 Tax=Andalucia godoyi TaxID=505711 RepID=A0A8K0F477_ANDGO|nr:Type II secretion system (T2SS)-related protein GspDN2 [Andalucia godoyi]|eukprot:ANDGO_01384.mRNA.1 Type II secretion system (T2SS)-related protein GspDN2